MAAVVSVAPGASVTLDDARHHLDGSLARYKLPTRLHIEERVPRNASGKLDKQLIRGMVGASA